MSASMEGVKGVIFDLDGTLVDSHLDFDAMRAETGCPPGTGLLEFQASLEDVTDRKQVEQVIHWHEMSGAKMATWMPGAEEMLDHLASRGVLLGIFTRNSRECANIMMARLGIPCDDLVTRDDAPVKPDPGALNVLLERWSLSPSDVVCLGDFRYDLEAARAAGMRAGLYDPGGDSEFRDQADFTISHMSEFAALFP